MADEKAESGAASPAASSAASSGNDDLLAVLREILDTQRQSSERQARFLWLLIPIFALLCVQVVLLLFR